MAANAHIITFKADDALVEAMEGITNRSQFIRAAILAALESTCPLCLGTGVLTPRQRAHWEEFRADHGVEHCDVCDGNHLICLSAGRSREGA